MFFVRFIPILILFLSIVTNAADVQRFPPPDFESGHTLPPTETPSPRENIWGYIDVGVLLVALSIGSYLVIKKRTRTGIFVLMVFSLLYFGFYRKGCICSIGAIQNISLGFFDASYAVPFAAAAFFIFPLLFALFFGRVFCAGVCPLGAMQDLLLIKPIKVPSWLQNALSILPYFYLGAAVMFAALGSTFIICKYDPFVTFFRLSGNFTIVVLSVSMLVICLFVGRPYCLFLCPYSVLLRHFSRLSLWRVTVAPESCCQCQLCEDACPFGAITKPTPLHMQGPEEKDRRRLAWLLILTPVFILLGGWLFSLAGDTFARMHHTVRLAERVTLEEAGMVEGFTDASQFFRDSGEPKEVLYQEAINVQNRFTLGAWMLGGFMGLVLAGKLIKHSLFRKRTDYDADRAACLACGRCYSYCPLETGQLELIQPQSDQR